MFWRLKDLFPFSFGNVNLFVSELIRPNISQCYVLEIRRSMYVIYKTTTILSNVMVLNSL